MRAAARRSLDAGQLLCVINCCCIHWIWAQNLVSYFLGDTWQKVTSLEGSLLLYVTAKIRLYFLLNEAWLHCGCWVLVMGLLLQPCGSYREVHFPFLLHTDPRWRCRDFKGFVCASDLAINGRFHIYWHLISFDDVTFGTMLLGLMQATLLFFTTYWSEDVCCRCRLCCGIVMTYATLRPWFGGHVNVFFNGSLVVLPICEFLDVSEAVVLAQISRGPELLHRSFLSYWKRYPPFLCFGEGAKPHVLMIFL